MTKSLQLVFDVCDQNKDQGLTLKEVQEQKCLDLLTSAFGITNDNVIKSFATVDQNEDGVVSKREIAFAFENLRAEAAMMNCPNQLEAMGLYPSPAG